MTKMIWFAKHWTYKNFIACSEGNIKFYFPVDELYDEINDTHMASSHGCR